MPYQIKVFGQASGKLIKTIPIDHMDQTVNMLDLLRAHSLPIASSCDGEGACKKCIINNDIISCQISIAQFLEQYGETLQVAYL